MRHRHRGTDPNHRNNMGLRTAMQRQGPLIHLHGIVQGLYEAAWPVFIVENHPETLSFVLAIDDQIGAPAAWQLTDPAALTAAAVRDRGGPTALAPAGLSPARAPRLPAVLAICRLRHDELLEAAHILPDGHPLGEPVIPNGLAL